jgi:surface carbohydrate biosynthesis protein
MKNFIKRIFKIKFTIKIPPKKKIIIYDINSEKILSNIIKKNFIVMPTRLEEISLPILALSLMINLWDSLKFREIYFNYLKTFIILTKPICVVTFIDNDERFFKFKKYLKNIKFIAIQNGYRFYKNDLYESIQNSSYKFECDEYYCFGENVKNYLNDKIQANIIVTGSLKNNYCLKSRDKVKKNLCFISSFGISNHKYEELLLNIIHEFCQNKKVDLEILARSKKKRKNIFLRVF